MTDKVVPDPIWTISGVNMTGKPFVKVKWGEMSGQLSPDEARAFALRVIETADAADHDAALVSVMGGEMDETTSMILYSMRKARGVMNAAQGSGAVLQEITPEEEEQQP